MPCCRQELREWLRPAISQQQSSKSQHVGYTVEIVRPDLSVTIGPINGRPDLALISGVLIIGWIVVQVVVLRAFSLFQPAYMCVGACLVAASRGVRVAPRSR